jgi:hypothetical protein
MNKHALDLIDLGFEIIPITPGTKIPPKGYKWRQRNITKEQIKKLKKEYNWAVRLKEITVIDIDTKQANGYAEFKKATGLDPEKIKTYKVRTPSGGLHLYFKGESEQRIKGVPSVDLKSSGGYVLAPSSSIEGKKYECISKVNMLPLPAWIDKLKPKKPETSMSNVTSEGVTIYESGRNNAVTSYTGTLWQAGTSLEGLKIEVNRFNEEQCEPPLPSREIRTIIKSITAKPRDISKLYASALSDFAIANKNPLTLTSVSNINFDSITPTPWVLDRRYAKGFMTFLAASGGSGKSLLHILDALSATTGKPVSGARVERPCNVWLHNCEDDMNMLAQRFQAAIVKHQIDQSSLKGLYVSSGRDFKIILAEAVRDKCIINEKMVETVIAAIKKRKIGLWLVDPLIHMHTLNENDNAHMNTLCSVLTQIADKTNCAIGVAHHVAKSSGVARGASAIIDASRIAYSLDVDKKTSLIDLKVVKNNLSPSTEKRSYRIVSVDFLKTKYPTLVEEEMKIEMKPETLDAMIDKLRGKGSGKQKKRCITLATLEHAVEKQHPEGRFDAESALKNSPKYKLDFDEFLTPLIRPKIPPVRKFGRKRTNREKPIKSTKQEKSKNAHA